VIISCPNCSARYRLAATSLSGNTRMRCAACSHRWLIEAEDDLPLLVPEPPADSPADPPAMAATQADEAAPVPDTPVAEPPAASPPASTLARNLAAIAFGTALALAAGALWVARIDPAQLPVLGDQLAAIAPRPLPTEIAFTARTTALPSGEPLLEITGTVKNTGARAIALSGLEARLAGPQGTVRRWRIALPAGDLQPGQAAPFATTATAFPANATLVGIRPAR
jgi:predicted Zn finger-like uncharacterized protein